MNRITYRALLGVLLIGTFFMAAHSHQGMGGDKLLLGQEGFFTLKTETKFGDTVLKPGNYQLQHVIDGQGHSFTFVDVDAFRASLSGQNPAATIYAVKCGIEPLKSKVQKTAVTIAPDGGVPRITKIEIKGENVAHTIPK